MITVLAVAAGTGAVGGWYAHKAYLRGLYKTMRRIKRSLRGGAR